MSCDVWILFRIFQSKDIFLLFYSRRALLKSKQELSIFIPFYFKSYKHLNRIVFFPVPCRPSIINPPPLSLFYTTSLSFFYNYFQNYSLSLISRDEHSNGKFHLTTNLTSILSADAFFLSLFFRYLFLLFLINFFFVFVKSYFFIDN